MFGSLGVWTWLCMLLVAHHCHAASITFLGVDKDVVDFQAAGRGQEGFWVPGFDCSAYAFEQPTNFSENDRLQPWAGPLKHIERSDLRDYVNRTFSMDGPCSTICGDPSYSVVTLPDGTTGASGIIVDPAADENSNNSVNRVILNEGTPLSFIVSVFVDNCNSQHSSLNRIAARGETALGEPVEPDVSPEPGAASFNGVPDLYRFRFDGFGEGDHIKVRLNGQAGRVKDGGGASFGGLLFDLP